MLDTTCPTPMQPSLALVLCGNHCCLNQTVLAALPSYYTRLYGLEHDADIRLLIAWQRMSWEDTWRLGASCLKEGCEGLLELEAWSVVSGCWHGVMIEGVKFESVDWVRARIVGRYTPPTEAEFWRMAIWIPHDIGIKLKGGNERQSGLGRVW